MYKKTYANLFSNSKINKSFIDGDGDVFNIVIYKKLIKKKLG